MKKTLTICFAISAFAISGALLLKSIQEKNMSDPLLLANVAALATASNDCPPETCSAEEVCVCAFEFNGFCLEWECIPGDGGTCGSTGWTGDSWFTVCNVSKEEAMENFYWWDTPHKWWCCDSCPTTWYCGNGN